MSIVYLWQPAVGPGGLPARSAVPHLAYGFNLYSDVQTMLDMGFDWIRLFRSTSGSLSGADQYHASGFRLPQ